MTIVLLVYLANVVIKSRFVSTPRMESHVSRIISPNSFDPVSCRCASNRTRVTNVISYPTVAYACSDLAQNRLYRECDCYNTNGVTVVNLSVVITTRHDQTYITN